MVLKINCDGGARGNPGPAAAAFVVTTPSGGVIHQAGVYLGRTTNNQAEYAAVWMALNWLAQNRPDAEADFYLDSQLVVNQLKGNFKVKNPELKQKSTDIKNFIATKKIPVRDWHYVDREKNFLADNLVNQTLDQQFRSRF